MNLISLTEKQKHDDEKWIKHFENKYDFKFYSPSYDVVPFVSSLMDNEKAKKRFEKIEYYLLASYPIDMNTNNHMEMKEMRYCFTKDEYVWHQMHNKLGINKWGTVMGLGVMSLNLVLNRDDLHVAPRLLKNYQYSELSFEKKVDYVKSLDEKLYNLLERVYKEY